MLHIPPTTHRFDPTGEAALEALDRAARGGGARDGRRPSSARPISAAALPAHRPPDRFWEGPRRAARAARLPDLLRRDRDRHRAGAGAGSPPTTFRSCPDVIATAKGLGAGYAADRRDALPRARLRRRRERLAELPARPHLERRPALVRGRPRGHGRAPARGPHRARARARSRRLRDELEDALRDVPMVREVRGHGFLLGVEYADPRDGESFLPPELGVAGRIDDTALERGLVVLSTQPTRDGYAGDQSLFAPAFTASDDELDRDGRAVRRASCARSGRRSRRSSRRRTGRGMSAADGDEEAAGGRSSSSTRSPRLPGSRALAGGARRRGGDPPHRRARPARPRPPRLRPHRLARLGVRRLRGSHRVDRARDGPPQGRDSRPTCPSSASASAASCSRACSAAQVFRSDKEEIGWLPVGSSDPELVPDGPWFQWHFDTFTAPPGAKVSPRTTSGRRPT